MITMRSTYVARIWSSIADKGRDLIASRPDSNIESLCRDLLSEKGEASGTAIARDVVQSYESMNETEKLDFFKLLATKFSPDVDQVVKAAEAYRDAPNSDTLLSIVEAVEPPRQELIRRLNLAPHGTAAIVSMRDQLLRFLPEHSELRAVDADWQHLLRSWFNRGFLVLKRIDWRTPAAILEKLFKYEAVHEIQSWADMRRRLEEDRRCFAFFHPALPDEPLIFVEVALLDSIATSIDPLLDCEAPADISDKGANTAVFYSINNCQDGLRGISFGNFLIKQVVSELLVEQPQLKTFITLSPVPRLRAWIDKLAQNGDSGLDGKLQKTLSLLDRPNWYKHSGAADALKEPLLKLCAQFLTDGSTARTDPVAAFHLGNGASVERINWLADTSPARIRQSAGIMVNYLYRLSQIERNHENYVNKRRIPASKKVTGLLAKKK